MGQEYKIYKTTGCVMMAGFYIVSLKQVLFYISSGYSTYTQRSVFSVDNNFVVDNVKYWLLLINQTKYYNKDFFIHSISLKPEFYNLIVLERIIRVPTLVRAYLSNTTPKLCAEFKY